MRRPLWRSAASVLSGALRCCPALSGALQRSPETGRLAPINHRACRFPVIGCTGAQSPGAWPVALGSLWRSAAPIRSALHGAPRRSTVLALGRCFFCRSGAWQLWRSICLHMSQPFSGGVWCSIFTLFFVITSLGRCHASSFLCLYFFCFWLALVRHFSGGMVLLPAVSINTLR